MAPPVHFLVLRILTRYYFYASAETACAEAAGAIEVSSAPHTEKCQREKKIVQRLGSRSQLYRT